MLNEAVSNQVLCDEMKTVTLIDGTKVQIAANNPWFDDWQEIFFATQFPSDHEFTRHLLACLIVVSSSDPNPVEQANHLTKKVRMMQSITPAKLPKWIASSPDDALNCYIMLHDGSSGDISKAQQAFDNLKATFGEHKCFLIQINSEKTHPNTEQPDLWAKFVKNYHKHENTGESNPESASKTPQEIFSQVDSGVEMFHPLSPLKEGLPEISTTNQFPSNIIDSTTPQKINPNVWANEPTEINVHHGGWLTTSDIDNLKHFVQDFTIRALIPYVEKIVGILNDSITNKKSVSKSLLGATKRWFNTNKPTGVAPQTAVIYTSESIELQTRKLGDLYFMFGNYNLAFQAYHQAKRDFYADSAWQFYAGALEMAALSAFMSGTSNRKTQDYMEEAITTYLTVCKLPHFATRATLLSVECLKSANLHCEAAKQLTRMTSEDADLRSALLLEQAAYCYLLSQPTFYRKYSFHSVLSGHRYTKAGQRKHAFRMYKQAEKVISNRGWNLAEDHIEYTISKQAIMLKKLEEADECLSRLLRPTSLQNIQQQAIFLREYLTTKKTLVSQSPSVELTNIALPCLKQNSVRVLVTSTYPENHKELIPASNIDIMSDLSESWKWNKLEEMVSTSAKKQPVMIFKPSKSLFSSEFPSIDHPLSVFGEPINIAFTLENPIKPSIIFENVTLIWEFKKDTGELFSNRNSFVNDQYTVDNSVINCTIIDSMEFGEYEKRVINMRITSKFVGYLRIVGIAGKVSSSIDKIPNWGKLNFDRIAIDSSLKNEYDRKLEIQILPSVSALHIRFTSVPKEVLAGEIFSISLTLTNVGDNEIHDVYLCTDCPRLIIIDPENNNEIPLSIEKDVRNFSRETFNKDKEARRQFVTKIIDQRDNNHKSILPNETKQIKAFIQAPHVKGQKTLKILIYYNVPENYPKIK
jgi:trafficking protein particle complex subunit 8